MENFRFEKWRTKVNTGDLIGSIETREQEEGNWRGDRGGEGLPGKSMENGNGEADRVWGVMIKGGDR